MAMDRHSNNLVVTLESSSNIAEWINDRLAEGGDETELEALDKRVGELATRLEILYHGTANQLEQTLESSTRTMPRLAFDLQTMRESTLSLRTIMHTTRRGHQQNTTSSDASIHSTLDRLRQLNVVKSNMSAAQNLLRETENFNTLESDVTADMQLGDVKSYRKTAQRLKEAEGSLAIFENTPDYESRKALVTSLENQLEASLSASLVAAVGASEIVTCKDYFEIFKQINRESEYQTYYNGARRHDVVSLWSEAHLVDCGEPTESDGEPFVAFLRRFLSSVESLVLEEKNMQTTIFPKPIESLGSFIQSLFDSLTPSLSQRLEQYASTVGPASLPTLVDIFQAVQHFVVSVSKVMEKLSFLSSLSVDSQSDLPDTELHPMKSRRLSKRLSMSSRRTFSALLPNSHSRSLSWELPILEPILDYQSNYAKLEIAYIDLKTFPDGKHTGSGSGRITSEREREFREKAVDLFSALQDAIGRSSIFTCGYGSAALVEALEHALTNFMAFGAELFGLKANQTSTSSVWKGDGEFEDYDYSDEDWSTIQTCLRLLDASKSIFERMQSLESKLIVAISHSRQNVQDFQEQFLIRSLGSGEKADMYLLNQSTLNSMDLQNLFEALDRMPRGLSSGSSLQILKQSHRSVESFTKGVQSKLCKTILGPLTSHLSSYSYLSVWSSGADGAAKDRRNQMPTFSVSPTQSIQRVAEGLLNLPRLFDAHGDDEALAFLIELLPFIGSDTQPSGQEHSSETEHSQSTHPVSSRDNLFTAEQITATWLSSLTLSLLNHLTGGILPQIKSISVKGAEQLAADLAYLGNIVQALNVESIDLELWKRYTELDDEMGKHMMMEAEDKPDTVLPLVAQRRGWR